MSELGAVQNAIEGKTRPVGECSLADRVSGAIKTASGTGRGWSDVLVLLRMALRRDEETRRQALGSAASEAAFSLIEVERLMGQLDEQDLGAFGLSTEVRAGRRLLRAKPWAPAWLDDVGEGGVDELVSRGQVLRRDASVPADPFLGRISPEYVRYQSPGQRAAVRSALHLPPGGTLVINLPTGGGKTLGMLAPARFAQPGSLSVIIVPTVALALDQQRRFASEAEDPTPTAYHGGLSGDEKQAFRKRIAEGRQQIVFTNPEAAVASLARHLSSAAAGGRLALFGIDEAHVVAGWGEGFRPQFQALAGLHRHCVETARANNVAVPRTVLASATLTADSLRLLRDLFGSAGPFFHLGAPVVRPELEYWIAETARPKERKDHLVEALRHLPRPAIVYATVRQAQAARNGQFTPTSLAQLAVDAGFSRFAQVDGLSTAREREEAIEGLRGTGEQAATLDLVFATSAFGLGIDVPDVRAVIHACMPETVDRFYQEVGRSGRDGRASLSVLLPTQADFETARSLASPKNITVEKAQQRWTAMYATRESVPGDASLQRVRISAVPLGVERNSEYNERWNLLTLGLLVRAGALKWGFSLPPDISDADEADVQTNEGWVTVGVLRPDHLNAAFWSAAREVRQEVVGSLQKGASTLASVVNGSNCVGRTLSEYFSVEDQSLGASDCVPSCSGCPRCRLREADVGQLATDFQRCSRRGR